jgi:PAS domain S-box-containing protein
MRTSGSTTAAPPGGKARPILVHLLGLALAAAVPFALMAGFLALDKVRSDEEAAGAGVLLTAEAAADSVERFVATTNRLLGELQQRPALRRLDPENCDPLLGELLRLHPEYTNFFTRTADGHRVCSGLAAGGRREWIDPGLYLNEVRGSRSFMIGRPARGGASGRWAASAVEPIVEGGTVQGVVGAGIDLAKLANLLNPRGLPRGATAAVIDGSGFMVARYPEFHVWVGRDVSGAPAVRRALARDAGIVRDVGPQNVERIWGFAPVEGSRWVVLVGVPTDAVLEHPRQVAAWIAAACVTLLLLALLLSKVIARRIAEPIQAIAEAARRPGDGLAGRLPSKGPAEAVDLARELERREAERAAMDATLRDERARLEGLVASAMDAVITLDQDLRIVIFNPAAERMFGITADLVLGATIDRFIPEERRRAHAEHVAAFARDTARSGRMGGEDTLFGLRADGEAFPIEASISKVDVGGRRYLTAIVRDVTEQVRARIEIERLNVRLEQRVRERTAELEAANQELQAFDYSISHDLRAPLGRIRGFAGALREDFGDRLGETGRAYLDRIEATSGEMDRLVSDMLELSLVSRREIERRDVDLGALARDVASGLRRAHAKSRPPAEVTVHDGLVARADPGFARIVLENLIGNAWKFTSRRESARIEIGCTAMQDGKRAFFVRDNGAGFDPAVSDRLFEPFRRFHSTADYPGTGVGLATVRRIVRRHGGTVWAEGAPGAGATFHFTLEP